MSFRVPLSPCSPTESSISLFVRHARACARMNLLLKELQGYIDQDYSSKLKIHKSLSLALHILTLRSSRYLEQRALALCGKCGGKTFKYIRSRDKIAIGDVCQNDNEDMIKKSCLVMQMVVIRKYQNYKSDLVTSSFSYELNNMHPLPSWSGGRNIILNNNHMNRIVCDDVILKLDNRGNYGLHGLVHDFVRELI